MHIHATTKQFEEWLSSSHKGDRFVYHTGHLLHDRKYRLTLPRTGGFTEINNLPLQEIQRTVMEAYESGFVVLAQHRVGEDLFQYLAIRTHKYKPAPLVERKSNGKEG